jgi:hypothetical protein
MTRSDNNSDASTAEMLCVPFRIWLVAGCREGTA